MVDFAKHTGKKVALDVTDPIKLFDSLDRRASHTNLRPPQIAALEAIRGRRTERDLILKMPTGAGKSTVALLYLRSYAAEKKEPVVYLCPTTQLVEQVLDEASKLGIAASHYVGGSPHPDPRCLRGDAVTVCTYTKLFNARTTFDRPDVNLTPSAIALDDAHAGIEEVRESFTLRIEDEDRVKALIKILDGTCSQYAPALWRDIKHGYPESIMEIPYWIWESSLKEVGELLGNAAEDDELKWVWPYLRDSLRWCRCVIAADGIEIVPDILPVRSVRAYHTAAHRLFMSATLADDAVLVRELGCAPDAAVAPISSGAEVGLGERMVLAPSLLDSRLERGWVMKWCEAMSKRYHVVVLTPSEKLAQHWEKHGARVVLGSDVPQAVKDLRAGRVSLVVFAQRYDGVDLPDDACRILVLDGMPYGQGIVDRYDSWQVGGPGGIRNRLVYRIEQGMGRAVRSQADYAVVILAGPEVASFISKRDVQGAMSAEAQAQLELAHGLADIARGEDATPEQTLNDMVRKCLERDEGWKGFYDERVRGQLGKAGSAPDARSIALADAERRAATAAMDNDPLKAANLLSEAIGDYHQGDERSKGVYLQKVANFRHAVDRAEAIELQKTAFSKNERLFKPPLGVTLRPRDPGKTEAAARVLRWYAEFGNPNGVAAELQRIRGELVFGPATRRFEQGIKDLAPFLGADGMRPETELNGGPDNLLLWPELSLVIEVKSNADYDECPKKDAEQLLHSIEWFRNNFPARTPTPMFIAKATKAADQVFPPAGTRVMTPKLLNALLDEIQRFSAALVMKPPNGWGVPEIGKLQIQHGLSQEQIVGRFTEVLR